MFVFSKIFWALLDPAHVLMLATLVAAATGFCRRPGWRRLGHVLTILAGIGWLAVAATPLSDLAATPLEDRFAPPALPDTIDGIIVLGGAVSPPLTTARGQPAVNAAAERLISFVELARRYPNARLLATGGSGLAFNQQDTEDVPTAQIFAQVGLDPARVLFEKRSRNTRENVIFSKALLAENGMKVTAPGGKWLLVTSAMHMPRSVGIFRAEGWPVIPYPVDYRTRGGGVPWLRFNLPDNLDILSLAAKEWVGLVAYRLAGWTDALYPGPMVE